jgi:hypothetical protein
VTDLAKTTEAAVQAAEATIAQHDSLLAGLTGSLETGLSQLRAAVESVEVRTTLWFGFRLVWLRLVSFMSLCVYSDVRANCAVRPTLAKHSRSPTHTPRSCVMFRAHRPPTKRFCKSFARQPKPGLAASIS